ncbi:hypothetical protein BRYFOR_05785 [Marvinbryantia formatexigens DSM 14469]|uniref:Uncharacterized protein n=1 Tax=Marvinbryantia formatexigens DSM 14469 TaxID=478749 RepID=C6LAZ0_9FIRM|nr:hypothetical protein BRYFOR_05785 [Marvinbryantia formatexigens DSM 14469]
MQLRIGKPVIKSDGYFKSSFWLCRMTGERGACPVRAKAGYLIVSSEDTSEEKSEKNAGG